jgi:hypothetical protein
MLENASPVRPSSGGRPARVRLGSDGRSLRVRSRTTNDPRHLQKQPNVRAQDRRRRDLIEAFVRALGPEAVSDLTLVQVRKAAELVALAEAARAAALVGGLQDVVGLIRIENAAARAVRLLGLKVEAPPARARGLELARQRWAEEAEKAEKAKVAREAPAQSMEGPPDDRAA